MQARVWSEILSLPLDTEFMRREAVAVHQNLILIIRSPDHYMIESHQGGL
jgi:hypothetical protein